MKIKKNDFVQIIAGKQKGDVGVVLKVLPKSNKVVVENVNKLKRFRKSNRNLNGSINEFESPIDISNVAFFDNNKKQRCKIGYKFFGDEKWRINKKTGEKIDIIKKGIKNAKN
ncbi:MAG: 50S ribosomal protein L24 [Bacilli bacterium]|nr:50S ribosomal protein L24 [Bacilli bacterium]